jgi:chemotaxis protein histidine kinase CheA/CheY-like chemotaxis protein
MFLTELDERSNRLIEGARAARHETVDRDIAGAMVREGHTIKGTAKVMGFDAVSIAGQMIEVVWRGLHGGDLPGGIELSRALEMAARAIPEAGRGDPADPGADLVDAVGWLKELVPGVDVPDLPEPSTAAPDEAEPADEEPEDDEEAPHPRPVLELVRDLPEEPDTGPGGFESPAAHQPEPAPIPPDPADTSSHDSPPAETAPVAQPAAPSVSSAASPIPVTIEASPTPAPAEPSPISVIVEPSPGESSTVEPIAAEPSPGESPSTDPSHTATAVPPGGIDPGFVPASRPRVRPAVRPSGRLGELVESVEEWARGHGTMVNASRLFELMNHIAELRIETLSMTARIDQVVSGDDPDGRMARAHVQAVRVAAEQLQAEALALASVPFNTIINPLPQLVKFMAGKMGRQIRFEFDGAGRLAVDREVLDRLADAVRQLVVNAVFHGIELPDARTAAGKSPEGVIKVSAQLRERMLEISVTDDGAGIDWDLVRAIAVEEGRLSADAPSEALPGVLFQSGFTTRASDGTLGSGNGLDVVAGAVETLYGRAVVHSTLGRGTEFRLTVPAWRSLQRLLIVESGSAAWGFPEAAVDEVMPLAEVEVQGHGDDRTVAWREQQIPLRSLASVVGADPPGDESHVVVIRHRLGDAALTLAAVDGVREVAVKAVPASMDAPAHVMGAAFMGDDDVVLVLEPGTLVAGPHIENRDDRPAARVLVVDDSMGARAVVSGSLASSGFTTSVAASVAEALEVLQQIEIDALVVDYAMPDADGVALVENVRKRFDRLPIVMLSGVADEADRNRAAAAGVNTFFDKSNFREGALAETLWELLQDPQG